MRSRRRRPSWLARLVALLRRRLAGQVSIFRRPPASPGVPADVRWARRVGVPARELDPEELAAIPAPPVEVVDDWLEPRRTRKGSSR